jgi:hypothetical protein
MQTAAVTAEPKSTTPLTLECATGHEPQSLLSTSHPRSLLAFSRGLIPNRFLTKFLYAFHVYPIVATCLVPQNCIISLSEQCANYAIPSHVSNILNCSVTSDFVGQNSILGISFHVL